MKKDCNIESDGVSKKCRCTGKGDTGDKGIRGQRGQPGIHGATGPQGFKGIRGIKGIPGTNGTTGRRGIKVSNSIGSKKKKLYQMNGIYFKRVKSVILETLD